MLDFRILDRPLLALVPLIAACAAPASRPPAAATGIPAVAAPAATTATPAPANATPAPASRAPADLVTFTLDASDPLPIATRKLAATCTALDLHSCMLFWGDCSLAPADARPAQLRYGAAQPLDGWLVCGRPSWGAQLDQEPAQPLVGFVWREQRLFAVLTPPDLPPGKVVLVAPRDLDSLFEARKQHGLAMLALGDSARDVTVGAFLPAFIEAAASFRLAAVGVSRVE
jgi:hypothetical protein